VSYRKVGICAVGLALASTPAAQAYELQVMPRLVAGPTVRYHNATAYAAEVRASARAINRAKTGVRLVPTRSRREAAIRIGYLPVDCRGTHRGQAYRGEISVARGCAPRAARHAVLHELGHALGLGHEDDVCSVMNTWWDNGKPRHCKRFSWQNPLQRDDIAGLRAIWNGEAPPVARPRIMTRSLTVRVGEAVDFVDASDGRGGWLSQWSFGDGATATGPAVRHVFTTPGVYSVRLLIASGGRISSVSELVTVLP